MSVHLSTGYTASMMSVSQVNIILLLADAMLHKLKVKNNF